MLSANGVNDAVVLKENGRTSVISRQQAAELLAANYAFSCKNVTTIKGNDGRPIKVAVYKMRPAKVVQWSEQSDGFILNGCLINQAVGKA